MVSVKNGDFRHRLPEQLEGETEKAYWAFCDYRSLGASRSVKGLAEHYQELAKGEHRTKACPTTSPGTLANWSHKYRWNERVAEFDRQIAEDKLRYELEERKRQWREEVESYRERNKKAGQAMFNLSILLTQKALKTLSRDDLDTDQAIRTLSAIAKLAESSQSLEGTALGIDQLLNDYLPEN